MSKIKWLKVRCPECGRQYEYKEGGYKPATCSQFQCVYDHLHPEVKKGAR